MAEQIQYRPAEARRFRSETEAEFERLEGRLAEINGLLDELYASGIVRWLKDFAGALPQVSTIAAESMNTPQGQAGMRNLFVLAQQLGRIDPDRFERTMDAVNAGLDKAGQPADANTPYNPPGITGVFRLLRDEELWAALSPLIAGAKTYAKAAAADSQAGDDDSQTGDR